MVAKIQAGPFPYENVTRVLTAAEKALVSGVVLNEQDVDRLVEKFRNSLTDAAITHSGAVQDDININAEVTVRLSRHVEADDHKKVNELIEREVITDVVRGSKVYKS